VLECININLNYKLTPFGRVDGLWSQVPTRSVQEKVLCW
jgi:hypothetical protein